MPPSTDSTYAVKTNNVHYYLSLEIKLSETEREEIQRLPIRIFPRVSPLQNLAAIDHSASNRRGLSVNIKMKPAFVLCDKPELPLSINIQNPSREIIKEINVEFVQKCDMLGLKSRSSLMQYTIPGISNLQLQTFHETFLIPIPVNPLGLLPSYKYRLRSYESEYNEVEYVLKIEICIGGLLTNLKWKIPVRVVNQP